MSAAAVMHSARAVAAALPEGRSLPEATWARRHRGILAVLWLHAAGIFVFAASTGHGVVEAGLLAGLLGAFAVAASVDFGSRKTRAAIASLGLLTSSAVIVHLTGGLIEAHFHFFVMVAVITLYEDWVPFLLAFVYVVVQHGAGGVIVPASVYNHHDAVMNPWGWAVIHGLFVSAAGAANVVTWRLNEDLRRESVQASERRADESEAKFERLVHQLPLITYMRPIGQSTTFYASPQVHQVLGYAPEEWGADPDLFPRRLHLEDRDRVLAARAEAEATGAPLRLEYRMIARDGRAVWFRDEAATVRDANGAPLYAQGFLLEIDELKAAEAERERRLEHELEQVVRLRELDRLKDSFVATVSHELRTPLTSTRGYLDLVLEGAMGDLTPHQQKSLAVVDRNAERLLRLVGDLLFVAQVNSGSISLELAPTDVAAVVRESAESAQPTAAAKGVELVVSAETSSAISADPARLGQLMDNLVSNAIKFTPSGGSVHVRSWMPDGTAFMEVSDTGAGISAVDQERIFDRFFRTARANEHAVPGTGLGLAIAKAIAEAHGGSIAVSSEEGRGTTFRVALPADA